ncbi:hypothetical protein CR513_57071, partial [Mucuna pruriens]
MASSNFNFEDLSPKSRLMMKYIKKLEAKMERLEGVMESMKLDSHGVMSWYDGMGLPCKFET